MQNAAQHLKAEAAFLEEEVEYLLGYVSRFGDVEAELQELARSQGYSIDQLVQLIRENAETMDLMRVRVHEAIHCSFSFERLISSLDLQILVILR